MISLCSNVLLFLMLINSGDNMNSDLCTVTASLFWQFSWKYFKDEKSIAVFSDQHDFNDDLLKCSHKDIITSVSYTVAERYISAISRKPKGRLMYKPTFGVVYVIISESKASIYSKLEQVARLDHMAKVIVVINATSADAADILKSCWHDHNMLNVVLIHNIIQNTDYYFDISAYDPFIIRNRFRGHAKTYQIRNQKMLIGVVEEIQNRLRDVQEYPLRICMFSYPAISIPVWSDKGKIIRFSSLEGELMHTLAKAINFNASYSFPRDGRYHGMKLPNGTMYGAIREIEEGVADIAPNLRPIGDYGQNNSVFLVPSIYMELGFLMPKMNSTSHVSYFRIFSVEVSTAIISAFVLVVISWWCLQKMSHALTNTDMKEVRFIKICLTFFGGMLLITQPNAVPWHERYLFLGWIMFSIIMCYSYQATMLEHLVTSDLSGDINSLQELADSDLNVITFKELSSFLDDVAAVEDEAGFYKTLVAKKKIVPGKPEAMQQIAYDRNAALLFTKMMCKVYQAQLISGSPRRLLTHFLSEAPPARFSSLMVPQRSPFKDRFDEVILRFLQAGLVEKWTGDNSYYMDWKINTVLESSYEEHNVYTMKELSFIFQAWSGCCAVCFLVFVGEVFFERVKVLVRCSRISL